MAAVPKKRSPPKCGMWSPACSEPIDTGSAGVLTWPCESNMAMLKHMRAAPDSDFRRVLANLFRKRGWRILRQPVAADLVVQAGKNRYVVSVKAISEGRRDRLVSLLSQAILEAQA